MDPGIVPCMGIAEPFAALSHLGGAAAAVLLSGSLLRTARGDRLHTLALACFALCVAGLLASSGLYHLFDMQSPARFICRRLDHIGIWLTTAGCATPIACLFLRGRLGLALLVPLWAAAIAGAALKTIYLEQLPPWVGVLLFVGFGAVGIPVAIWLVCVRGLRYTLPFFLCGVCLTVGALLELIEEPTLIPGVVGYHEVVHVFVMAGLFFHWGFLHRVGREAAVARAAELAPTPQLAAWG